MRKLITTFGVLAALSCLPATAQKEKSTGDKKKTPATKDATKDATKIADTGGLETKMIGYWAPDPEAMMKEVEKELGEAAAQAMPLIQAMLANMAVEVSKGEVSVHVMGQKETTTYVVKKTDKDSNKITMQVTDEKGESRPGVATININGKVKTLTLETEGEKIVLNSITASEFERRKKAAAQPPAIPGLE